MLRTPSASAMTRMPPQGHQRRHPSLVVDSRAHLEGEGCSLPGNRASDAASVHPGRRRQPGRSRQRPRGHALLTGGAPTPREEIEHDILPALLGYYERFDGFGFWAAIEKASGDFLGWFHFRPRGRPAPDEVELGYRLRKVGMGQGLRHRGSRALIRKGFTELGVRRVVADTRGQPRSRRVMEKAGLTLVRTFHPDWPDPFEGGARRGRVRAGEGRLGRQEATGHERKPGHDREATPGMDSPREDA